MAIHYGQRKMMHSLHRFILISFVAAFLGLIPGDIASAKGGRPNVLFIAIDDLNTRLGCYGFQHIHSPNIDALARRGVRFDKAYCQFPSCGPSRASLLTGLRPSTTGVLHNKMPLREHAPEAITLPQLFRNHGYHVARVGKIFHQSVPTDIGTSGPDDSRSWDEVMNPRGRDKDEEDQLTVYTPQLPLPDQMAYLQAAGEDVQQTDGMVASETIELLERNRDAPFFIAAGFYRPHIPYIAPKEYFSLYELERTRLPKVPANYSAQVPPLALASTSQWPNFGTTDRQARECILAYDACVSFVDAQVGRVLDAMDRLGLTDETIIVLWGDHGYHLGEHGLWRKNSLYEESARAPLIIAAPQIKHGLHDCFRLVEFVDIYPTLAALAGIDPPENLQGVSLQPLLRNPLAKWDRPAFTEVHSLRDAPGRSVRTRRWRYTQWGHDGRSGIELYDEINDPKEMHNLAGDARYAETIAELSELLRRNRNQ